MKNLGINSCFTLVPALFEVEPDKISNAIENKISFFIEILEVAYCDENFKSFHHQINWNKDIAERILEMNGLPT